ncbi:hypothetical protein E4T56_gene21007 [Termitomyces sp. T112]|nr:hypothetical protein E4T56_gene21007 [Termitomyces sp. T112]KNZ76680.1 hypothetical protein J132_09213 [Termitomyces sp. J132]
MDKFKKIKTKIFKSKSSKEQPLSVPLRSSSETEDYIQIKPGQRYPGWPQFDVDPDDFTRPYFPRRPYVEKDYVEKKIVDQFPAPPTRIPEKPLPSIVKPAPKRPSVRPPTMDFSDFAPEKLPPKRPSEKLLPKRPSEKPPPKRPSVRPPTLDFSSFPDDAFSKPQQLKAKVDTFDAAAAARNAARLRSRQRTPSSIEGQTQSLNVRHRNISASNAPPQPPGPAQTQPLNVRRRNVSVSNAPAQPPRPAQTQPLNVRRRNVSVSNTPAQPSGGMYNNYAASQSMRNIDPRANYRACLPSQRQAGDAVTYTPSDSSGSIYSCSSAAHSAYNLSPSAQYQVPSVPSNFTPAVPSLPSQQTHEVEGASVGRRNASSASSRSAHAMRRHGMLPPPPGSQHHEILRVLRGPHAVKLQTPHVPSMTNEYISLPVNDTKSSAEWGAKSSRVAGGVATVAGYGRQRY